MKHLLFAISFVLSSMMVLSSCHHATPQEKAEALASEYIKNNLYFPESYKVIQCQVDSAFGPQETPETISRLIEFSKLFEQLKEAEWDVRHKEDKYELYKSMGNYSSYNTFQTREAKAEFEKAQAKFDKLIEKISSMGERIQELNSKPKEHAGWKVMQGYNAQTNGGQTRTGYQLVLVNKEATKVLASYGEEELEKIASIAEEFQDYMQSLE